MCKIYLRIWFIGDIGFLALVLGLILSILEKNMQNKGNPENNSAPIIGIPGRSFRIERDVVHEVFAVGQYYVRAVIDAGGVPLPVPPIVANNFGVIDRLYECCDGLLFSGGEDIHPRLYGEEPHPALGATSEDRDECDFHLLSRAKAERKPVLGICRGLQMTNIVCGGSLYQDLPSEGDCFKNHPFTGWRELKHDLRIVSGSRLHGVLGCEAIKANSLHHQGIKNLGNELKAVAFSEDGLVEGIEAIDPEWYMMGVQCHPETLWQDVETSWQAYFQHFVRACAAHKEKKN